MTEPQPFPDQTTAEQAHLRIMETTDLHVHVFPYDYYLDQPVETLGLARTAALIAAIRAEAANSLLFDNGDFLQGNPMGDYIAYERGLTANDVHPVIAAMNVMGFDASTLGNHDFNYGLDFLETALAGAAFPVISANVVKTPGASPRQDKTLRAPYVILDRVLIDGAGRPRPIRIGVIGVVPPQIMAWDRQHLEGNVSTRDMVQASAAWVPEMREAGADIIVMLAHSGIGAAGHVEGMENAAIPLARIEGVDAILTGHSHLVFPSPFFAGRAGVDAVRGTLSGKPAVMAGFWGSHLGLIDLLLEQEGGKWRVCATRAQTRPIFRRNADRTVTALVESRHDVLDTVARDHRGTLAYIRRPVGRTTAPLHSYFTLVAGDRALQVVLAAQRWHIARRLKGTAHAALPILSATAPFKAGGRAGPEFYTDVPAGDLAIRNVADLYLYPNTVRAVKVSGAQVREWLERSASIFNRIIPGTQDQPLLNPDAPGYNFDVIDGVRYEIDLSQPARYSPKGDLADPAARRITALTWNGAPLDPAAEFVIATNSYRAGGGGSFPGAMGDTIIYEGSETNRDIVMRYIIAQGALTLSGESNWRFAPLPGTSVLFDTGPKAMNHIHEVTPLRIEPAGDGAEGFCRFRIHL